jgi:hypothetical protein
MSGDSYNNFIACIVLLLSVIDRRHGVYNFICCVCCYFVHEMIYNPSFHVFGGMK